MTNFSKNLLWLVVIVLVIGGFIFWQKQEPKELPTVRLGLPIAPAAGLAKIAADKNFFQDEGINVELKEFTAGKFALQALVGGSLDIAISAELPVMLAVINGEKISIIGQVNETKGFSMILRKDGAETFDVKRYFEKKRKIATAVGASSEFFTSEFFKKYDINSSQYEIVNVKPEDAPIVIVNNSVDGIAMWEPYTTFAKERSGLDKVFDIKNPELYSEIVVLSAKPEWAEQHQDDIGKLLRAFKKAESFVRANPKESQTIVSSFTKLNADTLQKIWDIFTLELRLSKGLISTMNKEAQWAKDTGKVPKETAIPNFREFIFDAPLKKVAPSAVAL